MLGIRDPTMMREGMSIREEEAVQAILDEVPAGGECDLDEDLMEMIRAGEQQVQRQYQQQAENRAKMNRRAVNIDAIEQGISEEIPIQLEPQAVQPVRQMNEAQCEPEKQETELKLFEQQSVMRSQVAQQSILDLDNNFPKLNFDNLKKEKPDVLEFRPTGLQKWLDKKEVAPSKVDIAIAFTVGGNKWLMAGVGSQLAVFTSQSQRDPLILSNGLKVTALGVSHSCRYIAVGVGTQVLLYQIKKGTTLALVKQLCDFKTTSIKMLQFLDSPTVRLCLTDDHDRTLIITVDIGLILTKVKAEEVPHKLPEVDSCSVGRVDKEVLMAVGGHGTIRLYQIEPDVMPIQSMVKGQERVRVQWIKNGHRNHLAAAFDSKIVIYSLQFVQEQRFFYLEQYLTFDNQEPVAKLFLLSQYHLIVESVNNIKIVATPLIPTQMEDPQNIHSHLAVVQTLPKQQHSTILYCNQHSGILMRHKGQISLVSHRSLQSQVDELILKKCAYREAFSLLVLVAKGHNYSYQFSYKKNDLSKMVSAGVQMATSTLIPALADKIILFRVGWVVQLCVQSNEESFLWQFLYPKLKERRLEKSLFQMIQIFVLRGQLQAIPQAIFFEIITHYAAHHLEHLIQKIVLCNRQPFEPAKLLSLLNQKDMNFLQFYLFSRGILSQQCDFYTPFLRAFTALLRNIEQISPNTADSALLCFLILDKSFRFEHIPSGHMPLQTKKVIVRQFFPATLAKTFIRKLSEYNLQIYLECYLVAFMNAQFREIIEEEEQTLQRRFRELFDPQQNYDPSFNYANNILVRMQRHIGLMKESTLFIEFYATSLCITTSALPFESTVEFLCKIFEHKWTKRKLRASKKLPSPFLVKKYLLESIQVQLTRRQDRIHIKRLISYEDPEIGYLVHRIDHNYDTSLQRYLSFYYTTGLFNYLNELCQDLSEMGYEETNLRDKKMQEVKGFVFRRLALLLKTNSMATLEVLYKVGETTQKIHDYVIKRHLDRPERLSFLTAVLTKWQDQDFEQKTQYMMEHLEEVCLLPDIEMRSYLDIFFYPIDQAIRVTEQRGNYLAKAILEARSGHIQSAFTSYERLITNTLHGDKDQQQIRQLVSMYTQQCVDLCKQHPNQHSLWIRLIKFINSFVASQNHYKVYLKVELERCSQNIITQMMQFLNTSMLIEFFTAPQVPLPLHKLVEIHAKLFVKTRLDQEVLRKGMSVFQHDVQVFRKGFNINNRFAQVPSLMCEFCGQALQQEQNIYSYSCGHSFHQVCHNDPTICLTCSYESDSTIIEQAIFQRINRRKSSQAALDKPKISNPIIVKTKTEVNYNQRKKRLKMYDLDDNMYSDQLMALADRPLIIEGVRFD